MTTRACLLSWDNSSRGLDASTALDYAKSIRIMTDVFRTTTFVSLYQAGEGIWEQFDKVMVIDNGRQIYYGPRSEARQYFINLGFRDLRRQTSADYVTGCTDENERQFADGRDAENTPSTPEKLEEAYRASPIYAKMVAERDAYAADQAAQEKQRNELARAIAEDRRRGVPKNSVYTVSFPTQVLAITKRQVALKLQDRTALIVNFVTAVIIAIITGTCYFEMPQSAAGAFTRGGVLFIALLFVRIPISRWLRDMKYSPRTERLWRFQRAANADDGTSDHVAPMWLRFLPSRCSFGRLDPGRCALQLVPDSRV